MANGANVNIKDKDGGTAIGVSSQDGHLEIVKLLIANGADVNICDNQDVTALLLASQNGYVEVVKLLLDKGANVNTKDSIAEWSYQCCETPVS